MTAKKQLRVRPRQSPRNLFAALLDPIDLLSEAIFSVLIVLTFTLAYQVFKLDAESAPGYTSQLFLAALGAALAWGIIDGVMYALTGVFERGEKHRVVHALRTAETEEDGIEIIAGELDHILEPITRLEKRRALYADMLEHLEDSQPQPVRVNRDDVLGALGSVLVAVLVVLPSLLPLLILRGDANLAIRVSNIVSFAVLFAAGFQWGRYSGASPWRTGLLLAGVSAVMVLVAILLGG